MPINPSTLDTIATNPELNEVALGLVQDEPWDGSDGQRALLLSKFQTYVEFIEAGELQKHVSLPPNYHVKIFLYCHSNIDGPTKEYLRRLRTGLRRHSIGFVIRARTPEGLVSWPL